MNLEGARLVWNLGWTAYDVILDLKRLQQEAPQPPTGDAPTPATFADHAVAGPVRRVFPRTIPESRLASPDANFTEQEAVELGDSSFYETFRPQ